MRKNQTGKRPNIKWAAGLGALAMLAVVMGLYFTLQTNPAQAQSPPTGYTLNTAIGAPTGLSARVSPNNKIVIINWTAPSGVTVDGYQVSRQLMPLTTVDPEVLVENSGDDKLKYRDSSITAPGNYTYWVRTVQGTEVSSAASVVTPYVWLEEPPASTQVSPHPSVDEFTQTVQDELFRLETSVADAAAGCLLYEIDHPLNSAGSITYTTEMDGILCVPLRDLVLNNCVPSSQISRTDRFKYTVGSYAAGQPAFLSSHVAKIWAGEYTYTSVYGQDSNTHDADALGQWPNDAILKYSSPGSTPNITFEISLIQNELNYETGTTDSHMGSSHDKIVSDLTMLHDRLVDITKTEFPGQYYLPAANCHFNSDEEDTIASADSEITLATTKYGGKDPGEDIDVFYIDMVQDVEYEVHIQGLDPTSEDARLALEKLVISRESNHSISEIEPQMKVLDADGNELDLVLHGETKTFMPDATARYYFEVWDDAHTRQHMSGLYKIVVNIVGESAGDVGQTTTDAQPIQANTMIPGSIGTAADADWFSFTVGSRNEAHTIVLDGDVTNHDLLINPALAIMKQNGTPLDADDQNIRDFGDYTVIELGSLRAGTYYAGVSAANPIETGEYVLTHYMEDHPGFVDHSTASVSVDAPVNGNIGGFWDRDRMDLVANGAHNYIVEIAGSHGFDASVTLKSDSPNDFPYTFTKRAGGKYVLAFVEGGVTGIPTLSEDLPVHFYLDVEANPGLTYGRNEDYVASIKTGQYNLESSAQDQYPANPAGVPNGQVYLEDGETKPMFAYMNGDGDKDGFKIHYPGTYIFRTLITGGVDADAVTGMALRYRHTGGNWLDVNLRWEGGYALDERTYIEGEFKLVLNQQQVGNGRYLQIYNRNPDTTVPYTMFIDRDDSHTNGTPSN